VAIELTGGNGTKSDNLGRRVKCSVDPKEESQPDWRSGGDENSPTLRKTGEKANPEHPVLTRTSARKSKKIKLSVDRMHRNLDTRGKPAKGTSTKAIVTGTKAQDVSSEMA